MPRKAIPIETPGEGDCFFAAISYNYRYSFDGARRVRRSIAEAMASMMYKPPYGDLESLTEYVLKAASDEDLYYYRLLMTGTNACNEIQRLWPAVAAGPNPRNGGGCPLAAWIVWFQYDADEIAELRANPVGYASLRNAGFLQYTLWGDTDLAAYVIKEAFGRPVIVYRDNDRDENLDVENPLSIYYTAEPHHFSAVRFVDPQEDESWLEWAVISSYGEDDVFQHKCSKLDSRDLVQIDPEEVLKHISAPKTVSTQYSPPPMSIPRHEKAFELIEMILMATRDAMGGNRQCASVEGIDFGTFQRPPIYVVSSNRSAWLGKVFGELFIGKLVQRNAGRPIIFVVDAAEEKIYRKNLDIAELSKKGVYVLACSGGFGMSWSRHCALKHARANQRPVAWIFDDNVETVGGGEVDVDDRLVKTIPAFSYSRRAPLIMERAVGFNLGLLENLNANFCPYFAYNKDDKSLEEVMRAKAFDYETAVLQLLKNELPPGVEKVDKGSFKSDSAFDPNILGYRQAIETQIASLDIWRDSRTNDPIDILKLVAKYASPRDVMKWQADIMFNILKQNPDVALAAAKWFSDAATN
jgi:hypothetical protein